MPSTTTTISERIAASFTRALEWLGGKPHQSGPSWPWPGIYLGAGERGSVWSGPESHVLVVGPPRSGKTTSIVIPTLALHRGPAVVTSTKPDVLSTTAFRRRRLGRCWLWDPTGTTPRPQGVEELRWSPVQGCEKWDVAVARAWALSTAARPGQQFTEAAHWVDRAQALLAPLLHAAALEDAELVVVLSWLHQRELRPPFEILQRHRAHLAHDLLSGISTTEHREQSGIFSTADSILCGYRTEAALAGTRSPSFDPDAFVHTCDTLYVCAPGSAQAQHASLVVALLQHLRDAIARRPRPSPSVLWALDELANISPIPDLPTVVADSAAQGLLVLACLQDLSQARARWGPAADGFLTLFPTNVILPGIADLSTLRVISSIAGEVNFMTTSHTRPHGLWRSGTSSKTTHIERRPRLPVSAVSQGNPRQAILLADTHPSLLRLTPWFIHPTLRSILFTASD
jgi:type IV secretory pathway TraG/TraD family ATPase VirD4